jgi:hypothetical protein
MCREKRPYRVVDYPRDTLLGWDRRDLEDEGHKSEAWHMSMNCMAAS